MFGKSKSGGGGNRAQPATIHYTPKPKCVSKPASTPLYYHTSAVGGAVETVKKSFSTCFARSNWCNLNGIEMYD